MDPIDDIAINRDANQAQTIAALHQFMLHIAPPLLDLSNVDLLRDQLATEVANDHVCRLVSIPDITMLFVAYDRENESLVVTADARDLASINAESTVIAVTKCKQGVLSSESTAIRKQVQVLTLSVGGALASAPSLTESRLRYIPILQQYTRSMYLPLVTMLSQDLQQSASGRGTSSLANDSISSLQKKVRELDAALELCQEGAVIPSVVLVVEPSIQAAAQRTTVQVLKGLLEKWNVSQVDVLLGEIGLNALLESVESREEFANAINTSARLWPAEIMKQTKLLESSFAGTAEREIQFWREMERKIAETKDILESAPILLTKVVLRRTNRVSESRLKEVEADLDRANETVSVSLSFLRDFPADEIASATDVQPQLSKAVTNVLSHFAKLKHSKYDFNRATSLLESSCAAVLTRLLTLLRAKNLLQCDFLEFIDIFKNGEELFNIWEMLLATQRSMLKDVAKRRNEKLRVLQLEHESVRIRLQQLHKFREQHERLLNVFTAVLSNSPTNVGKVAGGSSTNEAESNLASQLQDAYGLVLRLVPDILDVTSSGASAWLVAQQQYEKLVERIETKITRLLEERLGAAETADEMFRVFSTFNPLFFRPAIRNAVNSFRSTLVKNVQADVRRLQDKFKLRYDESMERATADLRDIPPLSGRIIWARQIENQLVTLMKRMEDVLGVGWEAHFEGKQLKDICEELRGYLDTTTIYNEWLQQQLSRSDANKYSKIKEFLLLVEDDPKTSKKTLKVNFDDRQIVVFKEVRYLESLLPLMTTTHKIIPHTVRTQAKEAFTRYPVAMALQAALAGYQHAKSCLSKVSATAGVDTAGILSMRQYLLAGHIQAVRDVVKEAVGGSKRTRRWIKWDSPELNDWVSQLTNKVISLQERVDDVLVNLEKIDGLLNQLKQCNYSAVDFGSLSEQIQTVVDDMQSKGLSNIAIWVKDVDARVEQVLVSRCREAIDVWERSFLAAGTVDIAGSPETTSTDSLIPMEQTVHEILLANQILYLSPPLEQARVDWIRAYKHYLSVVTNLPRLVLSRFAVFAASDATELKTYSNILSRLDGQLLGRPYRAIEKKIGEARVCVQRWLQYQALWDSSVAEICERIGQDIPKWCQLLSEIKEARTSIDSVDDEQAFGPIIINYRQVQHRINVKYDTWQKETQQRFGALLLDEIKTTKSELHAGKERLEAIYLEGPTKDVIAGVEYILKCKSSVPIKVKQVEQLEQSEKLLTKQRFGFPRDWVSASNVVGALTDFKFILQKRSQQMDLQLPALQLKIREEDSAVQVRVDDLIGNWEREKPVTGRGDPSEVLQLLSMYSSQVAKLKEEIVRIRAAKEALGLDYITDNRLTFVSEEMGDLKDAWQAVLPTAEKLSNVRQLPLKDLNPIKVRKALDDISNDLRSLPAKVRSYACVEILQERVSKKLAVQVVLRDLCTEALKDRHWKPILHGLGIRQTHSELTVGSIYDCQPLSQRKLIQDVLATAQGELALEQFLKTLKDQWTGAELTLIPRDNIRLITGWEILFSTLEDNLNSLASLKQSPYFRNVAEFQEDTTLWENRLTALRGIFDVWVEVQRKWVYLRGIFKNPDIKAQLPAQFSKFKAIDTDFTSLMKRVAAKPGLLDLLQVDNLHRQLERQESTMAIVQKALGEYLEKQRQIFPRFYFVNNEDLVEIIGNSNEPAKIVQHLSKMFAAMTSISLTSTGADPANSPAGTVLMHSSSMSSKEGEMVSFRQPFPISSAVKEWLGVLESEMSLTLASLLNSAHECMPSADDAILDWMTRFPAQIVILAGQVYWTRSIEEALAGTGADNIQAAIGNSLSRIESRLKSLSASVLLDLDPSLRKKCEQFLTEMVYERDVTRVLTTAGVSKRTDFDWLYHLRFYWTPLSTEKQTSTGADNNSNNLHNLSIKMSNASFYYGYEYLGISERLVQTALTERCYLTLTQALHFRMGANPFGPAGTGKTESVKMLGTQLGRFVLVFNCDSSFDYAAMGRIFAGLCQVGAWGCFDEFNRLEERILSAVSQQILTIQRGLLMHQDSIELLGNSCKLNKDVGIFVTMNPGYAGRSNLPDNLKLLFRAVAMVVPDRKQIAQVMLFSQGIISAEELAGKIVLLFTLLEEQLSAQSHYDFGLRALKSVLVGAGDLKRVAVRTAATSQKTMETIETEVLIKSTCDSVLPKLVAGDIALFVSLLKAVFPDSELPIVDEAALLEAVRKVCGDEGLEMGEKWVEKILQLKQVVDMRHGVMLVGPSGTGKSTVWRTLLKAMALVDGVKADFYVIDPKSVKKEKLYGSLDPNTLEWTDGVFTKILRKVVEGASEATSNSATPSQDRRSWIVFDGDVDPEWAENLNSVLDDNKILTLPTGDRLKLPPSVRIIMEVDSLKYATLATVSRCGMVWFAEDTVSMDVALRFLLTSIAKARVDGNTVAPFTSYSHSSLQQNATAGQQATIKAFLEVLYPYFASASGLVGVALQYALAQAKHIMDPSAGRLLGTLQSLLVRGLSLVLEYNDNNSSFQMSESHMENFVTKWLLVSILWAFGGSLSTEGRIQLASVLVDNSAVDIPPSSNQQYSGSLRPGARLLDLTVNISDGSWIEWATFVPKIEIESHKVISSDVVVTTTDTVRHVEVLRAWLASHKPLILCGPPGSGKTMTLTSVLESMPEFILASLNFSSSTTPDLILKTFAQFCEIVDTPDGMVLQPNRSSYRESQWLVVFCDEINLPVLDKYGTQTVIMFMRQLVERGGYWNNDCKWISLRRIQFVGACNPPTDAGRVPISERFLRHAPLLLVDYPTEASLSQIYRCFNHALLKLHPNLRGAVDALNNAMIEFYLKNQEKFLPDVAPQYIYSPRELSRWVRAMYEAMAPVDAMTMDELVRLWAHEALRLFHDRLIADEDKAWCNALVDEVATKHFPSIDPEVCLKRPLLFSSWLKKTYQSANSHDLREFVAARLKTFYEEALDVPLVVFDDVLEHVLRIDNVLRHPMGHMLLVGESGVGKTVLSRFVAWINGLSVFQIKANNRYSTEDFDEDLKGLFRRVGIDGEKICFIFDESNVLSTAFLERMNALLAAGEVPGLFEGDERAQLLSQFRESFNQREGQLLDLDDELWRQFTRLIQRNLHVIFTMNPANSDFANRCTASPALFNRCVVDWFGTWSPDALAQVGHEFTSTLDVSFTKYVVPSTSSKLGRSSITADTGIESLYLVFEVIQRQRQQEESSLQAKSKSKGAISARAPEPTLREAVVAALVSFHRSVKSVATKIAKTTGQEHFLSPRDYLDVVNKFVSTEAETRSNLEQQQSHIHTGLSKLVETQVQVDQLRREMIAKEQVLRTKDTEANLKLTQMVEKQNEAEQRKAVAEKLTIELRKQEGEIKARMDTVEGELSAAEPALLSAKHSVQNIRKAQLDEVRALIKPPNSVRLTLEMVGVMIGEQNLDWNEIRKVIRRDDFIATVVNFDPTNLTAKQVKQVQDNYLTNSEIDYVSVDRASKACGPLYQWAASQISYATILKKIKPLRDEVQALQEQTQQLQEQQRDAVQQVEQLEADIKVYKSEYASAIRDTEIIRSEMELVTRKVGRAEALLASLDQEMVRWNASSSSFDSQMSTLIGDSLLASAFLTYGGIFDHRIRRMLLLEWSEILETIGIPYRQDLDIISHLSTPQDLMKWRSFGLPTDELAVQNAILLERFNRYPLVIDPSGQASAFLMRKYASQKMVQSSFLDSNFLKILASAIRFGTPLLVNDVESIDPILNPVLNKELQKTGGRALIRLGNEDIDFSPKFLVILTTRNPSAKFAPDLCSRVTVVNFTVTPASLEAQALGAILKVERPDVEHRRTEVLRLQAEQRMRLRELEESLLNSISAVQGAILDDDAIINNLEKIKSEAAVLNAEVAKTEAILGEVKTVSVLYEPLANAMATVYFALERLTGVNFLYQFSLQFFLQIIDTVLAGSSTSTGSGTLTDGKLITQRVQALTLAFFKEIARRVLRRLKFNDKTMFMVRLALIRTAGNPHKELTDAEADMLFRPAGGALLGLDSDSTRTQKFISIFGSDPDEQLSEYSAKQLVSLSLLPAFADLYNNMASAATNAFRKREWSAFMSDPEPENAVQASWFPAGTSPERMSLLAVLLVRALRPERTIAALSKFVSTVFHDWGSDWKDNYALDLQNMIDRDSHSRTPIMICSERGQDASGKVDSLAQMMHKPLLQVAMGSAEGFVDADRCLAQGLKGGQWVLLRNVHLCIDWLNALEKRVHSFNTPHPDFRLFLTCEIVEKLPTALLRVSEVVVSEASTGIRANILRFYSSISSTRMEKAPAERARLYCLLAWLNAILQERLRYVPLGWTKRYEFSEADASCSLDVIDQWVDEVASIGGSKSKAHVDPEELPWSALCTLLSQSLYGGRVDDNFDQAVLDSFVSTIFRAQSYSPSAPLVQSADKTIILALPDGLSRQAFDEWVHALPDTNPPTWLGLPASAETERLKILGQRTIRGVSMLLDSEVESSGSDSLTASEASSTSSSAGKAGLANVLTLGQQYLSALPTTANICSVDEKYASDSALSPIQRCLVREVVKGRQVLEVVRGDIEIVRSFCRGEVKPSNAIRHLIKSISSGHVPPAWKDMYSSKDGVGLAHWIADLAARLASLDRYASILPMLVSSAGRKSDGGRVQYWLGGMFAAEALILAMRQHTAQVNKWSLEDLELVLEFDGSSTASSSNCDSFVEGLLLEGAQVSTSSPQLELSEDLRLRLPLARLHWRQRSITSSPLELLLPMYLNDSRTQSIAVVRVAVSPDVSKNVWAQRGVAIVLQNVE